MSDRLVQVEELQTSLRQLRQQSTNNPIIRIILSFVLPAVRRLGSFLWRSISAFLQALSATSPRVSKQIDNLHQIAARIAAKAKSRGGMALDSTPRFLPRESADSYVASPLITIVVTVHNQSRSQLESCFSGIQAQTYLNYEVVVIDDGSNRRETRAVLQEAASATEGLERWTFIRQSNSGVIAARNRGLDEARGGWICFHDPDDELMPRFLMSLVAAVKANSDRQSVAIFHSDVFVRDFSARTEWVWQTSKLARFKIALKNTLPVTCLVRVDILRAVGGFDRAFERAYEDWALWARLASNGLRSVRVAEPLYFYNMADSGRHATFFGPEMSNLRRKVSSTALVPRGRPFRSKISRRLTPVSMKDPPREEGRFRVVFFAPFLLKTGGAELFLQTLAQGLVKNNHQVVFFLTHAQSKKEFEGKNAMANITPDVFDLSAYPTSREVSSIVARFLRGDVPTTVINVGSEWHYSNIENLRKGASIDPTKNLALLFNTWLHSARYLEKREHFFGSVTVYERLAEALREMAPEKPAINITVGTLDDAAAPVVTTPRLAKPPHIGWLGRLDEDKNPRLYVDVAKKIGLKARFSMAGSGPLLDEIRSLTAYKKQFEVLGHVGDSAEYLRGLDVLVITSNIEGISNVGVEALRLGVPVVSTDVGGMSELIDHGVNGLLYPAGSLRELEKHLKTLLADSGKSLNQLKKSTRAAGLPSKFTKDEMIAKWLALVTDFERQVTAEK